MKPLSVNSSVTARACTRDLLLLSFLLALSLLLIGISGEEQYIQKRVQGVITPISKFPQLCLGLVRDGWQSGSSFFITDEEVQALRETQAKLQQQNHLLRLQLEEAASLNYREPRDRQLLPARVIGHDAGHWPGDLFLDRGRDAGVFLYQGAVIADSEGLYYVGRIVAVNATASTLRPIVCSGIKVPAMLQSSGRRGLVLAGRGKKTCELLYVPPELTVAIGEVIVSSGEVEVVPPGLRLGTVCAITPASFTPFQRVSVTPHGDPYRLHEVLLLSAGAETAR